VSHQHHEQLTYEELCRRLDGMVAAMRELEASFARHTMAGEWLRLRFTASQLLQLDDKGSNALAYGVYNPNAFPVQVGLAGAGAAADGFVVPKQKLLVAPVQVNGHVELAVPAGEVGEGGFVWRVRFPTPQPFFVGALN